jgi:hypothetical protein
MFTAPSWGIKEADIEMGATIYRRVRAERRGESHKLAPTPLPTPAPRGGGHLHPPEGWGRVRMDCGKDPGSWRGPLVQ